MTESEIFSQYIGNESEQDSLFIKLSTDKDFGVSHIKPLKMTLSEKFGRGTPVVIFDFVDGRGDLANHALPTMDSIFYLDIGRSAYEIKRLKLRMTKISSLTSKMGSQQITYRMFLVHSCWDKFITETHSKSWNGVMPSEVVREIATECGWEKFIIGDSDNEINITQPNWTNVELMRWITENSTVYNSKPKYSGRIDGTFVFSSTQLLLEEQKSAMESGDIPVLRMMGQDDKNVRETNVKKNHDIPNYFVNYSVDESHAQTRMNGSGGVRSYTYDSHTDTFMVNDYTVNDVDGAQLSDWVNTASTMTNANKWLYNGRGSENKSKAMNLITNSIDNALSMEIVTEGSIDMRVGIILELIIPIPPNVMSNEPYNVMYSGFWLVNEVKHAIDFNKSAMVTNTSLIRSGHDNKRLEGYSTMHGGKFVKRE